MGSFHTFFSKKVFISILNLTFSYTFLIIAYIFSYIKSWFMLYVGTTDYEFLEISFFLNIIGNFMNIYF